MNYVLYFKTIREEYLDILSKLNSANEESEIEGEINSLIDYIFKYPSVQQSKDFYKLSNILGKIVDFSKSTKYSFVRLIKYKEQLLSVMEEVTPSILNANTIKVLFSSESLEDKYKSLINDLFLDNSGEVTILLHDNDWISGSSNCTIEYNIEEGIEKAVEYSSSSASRREASYFLSSLNKIKDTDYEIHNFITGSSYSLYGFENSMLNVNTLNASMLAQDLYYNFELLKLAVKYNPNIKNFIMPLAHYSFHFDLSSVKSDYYRELVGKLYNNHLNDPHNCKEDLSKFSLFHGAFMIPLEIRDVFNPNFTKYTSSIAKNKLATIEEFFDNENSREKRVSDILGGTINTLPFEEHKATFINTAHKHTNLLKFKLTEEENKKILREMLEFLKEHNINTTFIVYPMTEIYRDSISPEFKEIFYNYIDSLKLEYNFTLIDLYDDNRFDNSDFVDSHHLSTKGAIKTTKIIQEYVRI